MAAATLDDPDYFLRHFGVLCASLERYRPLLSQAELALVDSARILDEDALRLLVRLLSRRGRFFRVSKLSYRDIQQLSSAIAALCSAGFVRQGESLGYDEALDAGLNLATLLTKDEQCAAIAQTVTAQSAPAQAATAPHAIVMPDAENESIADGGKPLSSVSLKRLSKQGLCLLADNYQLWQQIWALNADDILFVAADSHFSTLKLLYFGNSWQHPSEFVVTELGHRRYEDYPLNWQTRRFDSREEIETALFCADMMATLEQPKHLDTPMLEEMAAFIRVQLSKKDAEPLSPISLRRIGKLKARLGREFERRKLPEQALALYQGLDITPARERAVRCLEALERYPQAFDAANRLSQKPLNDDELRASHRMLPRLAKKAGRDWGKPPGFSPRSVKLVLDPNSKTNLELGVEAMAVRHFQSKGYQAWHLENDFSCGLFGLALWDIIFMPVKGAFDHPFQSAPRDMYSREFILARETELKRRLEDLSGGDFAILDKHLAQKQGISNDWIHWPLWIAPPHDSQHTSDTPEQQQSPLWQQLRPCLDGPWLSDLLRHMLGSLKERRSGWPDLLLVKDGRLSFVEVKGPGDRLQPHQLDCLAWLEGSGQQVSVLYLEWAN